MLDKLFQSTTIPVLEQVVNFSQARHTVLAGNIANFDTPGYRTRDLSPEAFQQRLQTALEERDRSRTAISPGELSGGHDPLANAAGSIEGILYHDDNNRSLEHQVAAISENQIQHNLALTILTSQFRLLQAAINERP